MSGTTVLDAASWQRRTDIIGRRLVLPLLLGATALAALTLPTDYAMPHDRLVAGIVVVALAAVWSAAMVRYPVFGVRIRTRVLVFVIHLAFGAVLVWLDPWFGVFAITGYFFADELGSRGRRIGFAATALVLAASQTGGYPTTWDDQALVYAVMVVVNLAIVLTMVELTNRVMEQNVERGRMITELGEANQRLETILAENAGLHAQLLQQARDAGVVEERQRLAGEIHDTLAQGLTGIIAQLEAARQSRGMPAEWARHLALADSLARANLTEARRSVRALRPEQLEAATLPQALTELARDWSGGAQVPVDVQTTGEPTPVAPEVENAVYRITQEALSNVAKHADATGVHVTLTYLGGTLLLDVADDGVGFAPNRPDRPGSYGLSGMRRRLLPLHGDLSIESAPGQGTTLNATIPVDAGTGDR